MAQPKNYIMSEEVFDQICDLIGIGEDDRQLISIDIHLLAGEPVTYDCKRYAVKDE